MRRLVRSQVGQALVETAIVLPVVVLLLFAMLDAGRVFHAWIVVTNGAREGARAAAARQDNDVVNARIDQAMAGVGTYSVDIDPSSLPGPSGNPVTVVVSTEVDIITPLIENFFGGVVTVQGTAVMQME